MRHLMNTLFALSEDAYLRLENDNVVVARDDEVLGRFPLHTLEGILCFSYRGASPALMGACAENGITLSFFTPRGCYLATVGHLGGSSVLLRQAQYRTCQDGQASVAIARNMIFGKCYNARWVLERAARDHPGRVDAARLKAASAALREQLPKIRVETSAERLRGLEGDASAQYFAVLDELILQHPETFFFKNRNRRPPTDAMNAALSFTYALLAHDCAGALSGVGLDPQLGAFHTPRCGRSSLALDLMEEFRPLWGDRFVLTLINNRQLLPRHFYPQEDGAVRLTPEGRKVLLSAWQERKRGMIEHPFLGEKIPRGLLPYVQAQLLSRVLRGDLEAYPPYLWKF